MIRKNELKFQGKNYLYIRKNFQCDKNEHSHYLEAG